MIYSTSYSFFYKILSLLLLPFFSLFNHSTSYDNYEFGEFVTKVYMAAQNSYLADMSLTGEPKECYSINELGLSDTYDYKGYVCLFKVENKTNVYISLSNNKYTTVTKVGDKTYNYINYTISGEPKYKSINSLEDNDSTYTEIGINITNELNVVNNKSVNNYEI